MVASKDVNSADQWVDLMVDVMVALLDDLLVASWAETKDGLLVALKVQKSAAM